MSREAILKENFAKHLISLRKGRKWSQEELAVALQEASNLEIDITRSALASYENQKSLPRLDVFYGIARFFEMQMDELLEPPEDSAPKQTPFPVETAMREVFHRLNFELTELKRQCDHYKEEYEYYKAEYEKTIKRCDGPGGASGEESRAEFLKRMYHYPYWQEQFRTFLTPTEFEVFYGVQNNQTKEQLAGRLGLASAEVEKLHGEALEKVLAFFRR